MEVFNVKIIEYANGQVEVRKYSEPIGVDKLSSVNMTQEQVNRRVELGKKISTIRRQGNLQYNPFSEEVERLQTFEQLELEKERAEKNTKDSLNRTVNNLYMLSRQCSWQYFITLTFSPTVVDRTDYTACMKKVTKWLNNQRSRFAPNMKYVCVPELHADKVSWHFHGLLEDVGNMRLVDSGKIKRTKSGNKTIYNLDGWKYGFSTAVKIGDTDEDIFKVSNYITKYITKELCEVTKGKRRYFRSKNIEEPIVYTEWLKPSELDNFINVAMDSLGATELEFEKTCKGFVDVNYRYYKKR